MQMPKSAPAQGVSPGRELPAGIVDGVDVQCSGAIGAVDEPHETLQAAQRLLPP